MQASETISFRCSMPERNLFDQTNTQSGQAQPVHRPNPYTTGCSPTANGSIAVSVEGPDDHLVDRLVGHDRATQCAASLGRHTRLQVARTALAMLRLAGTGEAEPLLGSLVSLHFRHDFTLSMPCPPRRSHRELGAGRLNGIRDSSES